MRFLPVGLDLRSRPCVVVGGGRVGTRKARSLLGVGARVTVVAPAISEELAAEVRAGRVRWARGTFQPEHVDGARLVVLATDDPAVNAEVAEMARTRGSLLCDATSGERSEVIFGALHEDHGVTIATFTDGRDPARARRTRDRIAGWLDGRAVGNGGPSLGEEAMLVLVAHGSRDPDWGRPLEELTAFLNQRANRPVRLAYSQFSSPPLEAVVADALDAGVRRIHVLPLFMTAGGHVERDIRPVVDALRRRHPTLELELMPPVGELPSFRTLLVDLAREVTQ